MECSAAASRHLRPSTRFRSALKFVDINIAEFDGAASGDDAGMVWMDMFLCTKSAIGLHQQAEGCIRQTYDQLILPRAC